MRFLTLKAMTNYWTPFCYGCLLVVSILLDNDLLRARHNSPACAIYYNPARICKGSMIDNCRRMSKKAWF